MCRRSYSTVHQAQGKRHQPASLLSKLPYPLCTFLWRLWLANGTEKASRNSVRCSKPLRQWAAASSFWTRFVPNIYCFVLRTSCCLVLRAYRLLLLLSPLFWKWNQMFLGYFGPVNIILHNEKWKKTYGDILFQRARWCDVRSFSS